MIKTAYAYGLRRNELARLDVADLRPNPHEPAWGTYGAIHVRFGKAVAGGLPRRRTVLTVPEFDWIIDSLRQWVEEVRPLFAAADHPALWVTERLTRVSTRHIDERFVTEQAGHWAASSTAIYTSVSNDFKNQTLRRALHRLYPNGLGKEPPSESRSEPDRERDGEPRDGLGHPDDVGPEGGGPDEDERGDEQAVG